MRGVLNTRTLPLGQYVWDSHLLAALQAIRPIPEKPVLHLHMFVVVSHTAFAAHGKLLQNTVEKNPTETRINERREVIALP